MPLISVRIVLTDPTTVLTLFNQLKVYRSTTGQTGTYTEITDATTRLAIAGSQTIYVYQDTTGDPEYWYKSSFYNSTTAQESSLSDPIQGEGDPALSILSVGELLKNYLFGLDLTDDSGNPFPVTQYEFFIKSAVSMLEHDLDINLAPKTLTEERHDFRRQDYHQYAFLALKHYPVIQVDEVKFVVPNQTVFTFPDSWIQLEQDSGQINLVPSTGQSETLFFGSGSWFPAFYRNASYIPHAFRVTYTAGFASGEVPPAIVNMVGMLASFGPLNIAGDLLGGAGIASQSISLDGLSQSFSTTSSATNAGYGARLVQYWKDIKRQLPQLREYYKAIPVAVI